MQERVTAGTHLFAACGCAVLCHNDLHEGNVLVDGVGAVTGFIDVENMIAADPLIDLAKTLQYDLTASATNRHFDPRSTLIADSDGHPFGY